MPLGGDNTLGSAICSTGGSISFTCLTPEGIRIYHCWITEGMEMREAHAERSGKTGLISSECTLE